MLFVEELQEDIQIEEAIEEQELQEIANREIIQIITKLKNNKKVRENGICAEMMKHSGDEIQKFGIEFIIEA